MQLYDNETPYLYEPFPTKQNEKGRTPAKKDLRPWQGAILFLLLIAAFYLIGTPLTYLFGMYGNAAAEILVFLLGSVLVVKALRLPMKEVFSVRKPDTTGILGTLLMWFCTYQGVSALLILIAWMFPEPYQSLSRSMDSSMSGLPFWAEMMIVAVIPAICEEALHRGLLQYSLRRIQKTWLVIFFMGLYFGFFHMSLIRFLPMMMVGMVLSYIRRKTDNMFYSSLFHFVHNAYSVALTFLSGYLYSFPEYAGSAAVSATVTLSMVGTYLIRAAFLPAGLYFGSRLLTYSGGKAGQVPAKKRSSEILILFLLTAAFVLSGSLCIFWDLLS